MNVLYVVGVAASVLLGNALGLWLDGEPVDGLLYTSWALQVLGGAAIVYGLSERFFDVRSLLAMVKARLSRLFRRKQSFIGEGVASIALSSSVTGQGPSYCWASVERRVECLERDVESLQNTLAELGEQLKEEARKLHASISDETTARKAGDAQLANKLETAMVGSIHLEYLGVTSAAFAKPLAPALEVLYPLLAVAA